MGDTELESKLLRLVEEHRDLDTAIDALSRSGSADMLQVARLKKRRLKLKDEIAALGNLLIPDIIA